MLAIEQSFSVSYSYPVHFTRDIFNCSNPLLADLLRGTGREKNRILAVIDSGVLQADPELPARISCYAAAYAPLLEFVAPPVAVRGGEVCKHDPVEVGEIQRLVERHKICRHSFILAIGGGAVLDAAGYAAATAHRGVRLIRMPTTVLAQNDAGVGVKNGINAFGRKNFLGTFAPPFAVINDSRFLQSLEPRDLRAGIAEAVKVALIRDARFFDTLYRSRAELAGFVSSAMEKMIYKCAGLHLSHIASAGDPFEYGSSRPLDFGHWAAHKLEELASGDLRHGEAVAIGIALDSIYSREIGLLAELDLQRILRLLVDLGFNLYHPTLLWLDVAKALADFQEHLGGELTIPLLEGIGKKVDVHEIEIQTMKRCISLLAERYAQKRIESYGTEIKDGITAVS